MAVLLSSYVSSRASSLEETVQHDKNEPVLIKPAIVQFSRFVEESCGQGLDILTRKSKDGEFVFICFTFGTLQ